MSKTYDTVKERIDRIIDKAVAKTEEKRADYYSRRGDCGLRYLSKEEACEEEIKRLNELKNAGDAVGRLRYENQQKEDLIRQKNQAMLRAIKEIREIYGMEKTIKVLQDAVDLG